jgi:hypothetical protein
MVRVVWSWPRTAWVLWSGLVIGIAVYSFCHPSAHTVYEIYAAAARNWWAGQDLYGDLSAYYRYSPLFAIAVTPFSLLPDCWGNALWKVFASAVFVAGLWTFARRLLPIHLRPDQLAALFLLALPVSLHSLYIGQANLLMLGTVLWGLSDAAQGRWNRAAIWLALATLIKGYPLALALLLMALYPARFALRFAVTLGAGLLLPFLTQGPAVVAGQYAQWFHHLGDSTGNLRERLRSLDYLFVLLGRPLPVRWFLILELLAGALVFWLCLRCFRRTDDARQRLTQVGLLYLVWVVLFGPATESCTYVMMAPAVAWALVDVSQRPAWRLTRLVLLASLLLMGPLVTDLFGRAVRNFANEHGSQPIGALLFVPYAVTCSRCWSRARAPSLAGNRCPIDAKPQTATAPTFPLPKHKALAS